MFGSSGWHSFVVLVVLSLTVRVAAWRIVPAGEYALPPDSPEGLSGIAWRGGDEFYAVNDRGGLLHRLKVSIDGSSGVIGRATVGVGVPLDGRKDLEGVAWDPAKGWVWVSDEDDASVRAYLPSGGAQRARVRMPAVFQACRINASLEALTVSPDGNALWCCNEEALARPAHGNLQAVDDGPRASRSRGSVVRLQKFVRRKPAGDWTAAGQWAYVTDAVGGEDFMRRSRCGVAALCAPDDGSLLALERELSCKDGMPVPSFRTRIFVIDFAGASDVSRLMSLKGVAYAPVGKTRLFSANTLFANYEGMCLGPRLKDGSRTLLLVSDGGGGAARRLFALKLCNGALRSGKRQIGAAP